MSQRVVDRIVSILPSRITILRPRERTQPSRDGFGIRISFLIGRRPSSIAIPWRQPPDDGGTARAARHRVSETCLRDVSLPEGIAMDRQSLGMFVDACQVVAGRIEENPGASADLIRDLLATTPDAVDARAQAVIDGLAVRMLTRAQSPGSARARLANVAPTTGEGRMVGGAPFQFRVAGVLTFLEQRFADPAIRLSSAARHAALSPAYLARLLKASTGFTFLQHLRRVRVAHAERLMLTTMLSIKETAAHCGYNASGSFDRDFRRVHRCTPSAWRAEHRTGEPRTDLPPFVGLASAGQSAVVGLSVTQPFLIQVFALSRPSGAPVSSASAGPQHNSHVTRCDMFARTAHCSPLLLARGSPNLASPPARGRVR